MLKKIDTKSMIQVQSAGSIVGQIPNIRKHRQGLQNFEDIDKAISHQELDNLIKKQGYNITLPDQMIFTKEEVKEIVANIANVGRVPIDWVNNDTVVLDNKGHKVPDYFRERIAKGFCFDPSKNIQMEFRYSDPSIYQSPDIFEFLNSIYKALPYRNEGNQEYNPTIEGFQFFGTSELRKFYHRQQYCSQWREEISGKCGFPYDKKKWQETFQKMEANKQYKRLAGMSCCFFEIQTCQKALEQFPNDLVPTMKALVNIFEVLNNVSKLDSQNFMDNFYEYQSDLKTSPQELVKLTQLKCIIKQEKLIFYSNLNDMERMMTLSTTMKYIINQFQDASYDDPYLELIVAFFSKDHREFQDYLKNNSNLLFYDKLVLCVKYLDDQHLQEFVKQSNSLNQLIINGKGKDSINILQDYLDKTGDIQLVGVLAAHMFILQFDNGEELALLFDQYRKVLTQENLIEARVSLEMEIVDFQNWYNKKSKIFETIDKKTRKSINLQLKCECATQTDADRRICTNCKQIQPQCSVCDCGVEKQVGQYILCIKCLHGGHETHISEWFKTYKQCPHKDCLCECDIND